MSQLIQQLKSIILGHLLEFQILYAKARLFSTNDDLLNLKLMMLILLRDCYLLINIYEKSEDKKKETLDRIKDIENTIIELGLMSDSFKYIDEIYSEIIKVFNVYLFSKEVKET